MDPGAVRMLHDAFKTALFSPANTAVRGQFDMTEEYLDSRQYAEFIAQRAEYERAMVQRLGLKLD
jgi:tripartite-type tricarboxylate transporter receptor subunit TctC